QPAPPCARRCAACAGSSPRGWCSRCRSRRPKRSRRCAAMPTRSYALRRRPTSSPSASSTAISIRSTTMRSRVSSPPAPARTLNPRAEAGCSARAVTHGALGVNLRTRPLPNTAGACVSGRVSGQPLDELFAFALGDDHRAGAFTGLLLFCLRLFRSLGQEITDLTKDLAHVGGDCDQLREPAGEFVPACRGLCSGPVG